MRCRFFCEHCQAEVTLDAEACPSCHRAFGDVLCPQCQHAGKAPAFRDGCPRCGYLSSRSVRPRNGSLVPVMAGLLAALLVAVVAVWWIQG